MKSRIVLFIALIVSSSIVYGQYSRKQIKEIDAEIEQAYNNGEYNKVLEWCSSLRLTNAKINPPTFEYWLFTGYKTHDLNLSLDLLTLYETDLIYIKAYRNLSEEGFAKLDKLRRINNIYDRSILNERSAEVNEEQKKMVEDMIAIDSSFWQPYMILGNINYFQLDYPGTIYAINKVLQWQPANQQALQEIGYSYFNIGDYEKSIYYLDQVEEPYSLSTYLITVAYAHYHLTNYDKALWHSKEALKQSLNYEQKISTYSLKLNCERNLELSKEEIETLYTFLSLDTLKVNENNIRYTHHLAKEELGFEESLQKARTYSNRYPNNINYLLLKVYHYPHRNQTYYNEAVQDFDRLVDMDPNNYDYYMLQGLYLFNSEHSREQRARAMTALEHAYKLDSSQFDVHEYICRLFLWHDTKISKKYKKKAISNMSNKINADPKNPEGYIDLAKAYDLPTNGYGNNNIYLDSMLKYFDKALQLGGDSFSVKVERRHVYQSLGMFQNSIADNLWIAKHTKYPTTRKMCFYAVANNYMSLKNYNEAREMILKIKDEFPDDKSTI
ncbi:MAG: hypothetical protein KJP21_00055, partial [Bacteroidia bacterium]|nr:hypothetical protein [Bacteroidia bacterium]